jgi:hypothetical protein
MKKLIFLVVLATLFSVRITNAQTDSMQTNKPNRGQFVDKNNDGICDNYQDRKSNANGRNFVDKNNDGICDNNSNKTKNNNCCGQGRQFRGGNGNCRRNR